VHVASVKVADWGWTAILPGGGLLEEFDKPFLWIWNLKRKKYADFESGIKVPIRPFCGVMGVASSEDGILKVPPPNKQGETWTKHLTAGSTLMLPVSVDGALFSMGDLHAAQGDGEVCAFAIECAGDATLVFDVVEDARIEAPSYSTIAERHPVCYVTTGISADLMDASKQAVRCMIDYLTDKYRLAREEAYVLCSVAGDLRIHEVVNPNWIVGMMIPHNMFRRS
jgi:acetamidase/formamidase